jgi:two-component system, OmpR family, response regulator
MTVTLQINVTGADLPDLMQDIRNLAERAEVSVSTSSMMDSNGLRIGPASRTAYAEGRPVRLTRREFDLLLFLCENPRRVFRRDQLLTQVWGYDWIGGSRTVDVHIRRLRMKLGSTAIATVHGVGYRLDDRLHVVIDPTE